MRVINNSPRPQLPQVAEHPRCKPGERPVWVRVPAGIAPNRLALRAARLRVGVDALAATAIELALVERVLTRAGVALEVVLAAIEEEPDVRRLAPTPQLRRWELSLAGTDDPAEDELPELCLPGRLLQAAGRDLASLLADDNRDACALTAERAASRRGRTLETHLLATALLVAG